MCDPLTLGSLAIGAAGTAANAVGQAGAARKQEDEYNKWAQYQSQTRNQEKIRQEAMRQKAEASQAAGLQSVSAEAQGKAQADEAERLKALTSGQGPVTPTADPSARPIPTAESDKGMLSGQQYGGEVFQSDLAKKLSDAAASVKQRLGALATVNSYGGSFGGAGTVNPINQAESGAGIDLQNQMRKGSLAAYGVEHAVDPQQITYSNPIADVAQGFLGAGMQGVGQALGPGGKGLSLGGVFGKAMTPAVSTIFPAKPAPYVGPPRPATGPAIAAPKYGGLF
jgi:hypothetical protein